LRQLKQRTAYLQDLHRLLAPQWARLIAVPLSFRTLRKQRNTMLTSRSLQSIDNHLKIGEPTTLGSVSLTAFSKARPLSVKSKASNKEAKIDLRLRLAVSWLALFAEIALFAAGIFCLVKCGEMRETESEQQLRLAAQGLPPQSAVTLDQALQVLGARR
jgi:hypothetical protein